MDFPDIALLPETVQSFYSRLMDKETPSKYMLVDYIMATYPVEMYSILVYHIPSRKFLCYVLPYSDVSLPLDAQRIVDSFQPCPLSQAQIEWPKAGLSDKNYMIRIPENQL